VLHVADLEDCASSGALDFLCAKYWDKRLVEMGVSSSGKIFSQEQCIHLAAGGLILEKIDC